MDTIFILTLPAPLISESCIKIIKLNFFFTLLCDASKSFMKALKTFIKPFEAPQRRVKIKIQVNFFPFSGIGVGRVNLFDAEKRRSEMALEGNLI